MDGRPDSPPPGAAVPAADGAARRQRLLQWAGIAALAIACVLLVRLTVLVQQVADTLEKSSADLAQVLATAARISAKVDALETRLEKWQSHLLGTGPGRAASELASVLDAGGPGLAAAPEARAEVQYLLGKVAASGLTFEFDGETLSPAKMYALLWGKLKLYERSISSAEDFLARVAAATVTGKVYTVVQKDGTRIPLEEWLRARLAERRAPARE